MLSKHSFLFQALLVALRSAPAKWPGPLSGAPAGASVWQGGSGRSLASCCTAVSSGWRDASVQAALWKAGDLKGSPGEGEQCSGMDAHPQVSTLTVPPIPLTCADTLPHDLGSFLSLVLFQEIPVLARAAATGSPGLESLRVQGLSLAIPSSFVLRDAEIRDTVITWGEQLGRSDPLGAAALVGWPPHAPC